MELIRHTIEFIKLSQNDAKNILRSSKMTKNVAVVIEVTPSNIIEKSSILIK